MRLATRAARLRAWRVGAACVLGFVLAQAPARAASSDACVAAYEEAQVLRQDGKLRGAREKLIVCAAASCPRVTTGDCARWLRETDESLPSIVVRAFDEQGREIADVATSFDGAPLSSRADGRAVPVDPGEHTLVFERASAAPVRQVLIFREGEKDRPVTARWGAPRSPGASQARVPAAAIALGAVGAAALASFGVFGIKGYADAQSLKDSCVPHCSPPAVRSVDRELLAADISLGVAVVALGAAAWIWLSHRPDDAGARASGRSAPRIAPGAGVFTVAF